MRSRRRRRSPIPAVPVPACAQTKGYFNNSRPVVGHLDNPINYWKIYNYSEFKVVVNKLYKELEVTGSRFWAHARMGAHACLRDA